VTSWFEAEGSIPIDVDDWWWFAEKFGGGCGNQVGVWRGGKNNFLSAGGVFFLNNSEHSAGFLALCTKLFLIHIQGL
jgi:hypothetical protein